MTLLELLLVLAILGLVFGVGIGLVSTLDLGQRAARGVVRSVLRSAREAARSGGAPARVRLDAGQGTLAADVQVVVGTWHFEDEDLTGAFGRGGRLVGGTLSPDGYLGRALELQSGRGGPAAEIPLPGGSAFDLRDGFALDLALWPAPGGAGGSVLDLGGALGLAIGHDGSLEAWFAMQVVDAEGSEREAGRASVACAPGSLAAGRWTRVHVDYEGSILRVELDGEPAARLEVEAVVHPPEGSLLLAPGRTGFAGRIDALVVSALAAGEPIPLPGDVRFAEGSPAVIRFEPDGGLDRRLHDGPLLVELERADGSREALQVGLYGTID